MRLWQPLSEWNFRAGQYLTVSGLKPGGTSDISHIHSTETAHFSPCTSETWQMQPHSWTQNTNTCLFCCACAHTHMKSQIQAPHLFLYITKITVNVFSLPRLRSIDKARWTYAALLMESSSLRHLLMPGKTDVVQFVTSSKPTSIDYHHKVSLTSSCFYLGFQTELTGSQSLIPSETVTVLLSGDRKQIETHWVSSCCPDRQHPLQRAHPDDSITNYTVFSLLCLLSHSSLSSLQRRVQRRGIY